MTQPYICSGEVRWVWSVLDHEVSICYLCGGDCCFDVLCTCSCLLWQPPSVSGSGAVVGNDWDNSMCRARTHFVLRQTFVECSCSQLGAVGVASDLPRGYSWTLPAGLSAAVCILALIFSILLHLVYRSGTLLASRLFICVSFASLLFQVAHSSTSSPQCGDM